MDYAPQLRAVRAHFSLSQARLAPWLGLSREFLALVETGREALPAHARPWLRPWADALTAAAAETTEAPAPVLPTAGPTLSGTTLPGTSLVLARLAECHYQAQRLEQQLAALRGVHRVAAARLAAGPWLLAALPAATPAEATALALRRRWLARLLEAAADVLAPEAPAGPVVAALLAVRRQGLLHEAALLRAGLASGELA